MIAPQSTLTLRIEHETHPSPDALFSRFRGGLSSLDSMRNKAEAPATQRSLVESLAAVAK
jgi:hypothetical protein